MLETSSLVRLVIGRAIDVHRALGPGLLESVYSECLAYELRHAGVGFERQVPIPVRYRDRTLDAGYRVDLIIEGELIIEVKSVETLLPIHTAQLLTYVKLSGLPQGLLMNFNTSVLRHGLKSVLNRRGQPLKAETIPPELIHNEGLKE